MGVSSECHIDPRSHPITLTSVDISTTPAYIFAGHSAFGPDISNQPPNLPGNMLAAADNYDIANSGISLGVGASNTVGLGDVHFNVSSSSLGPIPITLVGFPTTNISDPTGNDITQSVGTTFTGGTVTVTSSSAVPEPSSLTLAVFATGLLASAYLIGVTQLSDG